jgi:hypothetical protein
MKYYILFFLVAAVTTATHAQNKDLPWIIKFNTTSLCDVFAFPTVQLALEKKISDNTSLSLEGGYQFYSFDHPDTVHLKPHGFKINIEYRYYISKIFRWTLPPRLNGSYIALQPFYRKNQYTTSVSYEDTVAATSGVDNLGVRKSVYGVNLKVGIQKTVRNKMIVDLYLGLGVANRMLKNTNREYDENNGSLAGVDLVPLFYSLDLQESSGTSLNISAGFRIGYKL